MSDADALLSVQGAPAAQGGELHIGVSNNDQGVHVNIMQRHADGTVTLIYAAMAPPGDSYGRAALAVAPAAIKTWQEEAGGESVAAPTIDAPIVQAEPVTLMTERQAEDWAWKQVKRDVGTEGWTAGDSGNYYGFFLWGWRYRAQYERQKPVGAELRIAVGEDGDEEVPCLNCHGDGMDPWNDYLTSCPVCQGGNDSLQEA